MWYTKTDIDEEELKVLYSEWCRALAIDEYFSCYACEGPIDAIVEYFFSTRHHLEKMVF